MKRITGTILVALAVLGLCFSCASGRAEPNPNVAETAPAFEKSEEAAQIPDVDISGKWVDLVYSDGTAQDGGFWFANDGKAYALTKEGKTYYYSNEASGYMEYSVAGGTLTLTLPNGKSVSGAAAVAGDKLTIFNPAKPNETITMTKSNVIPALKKTAAKANDVNVLGVWLGMGTEGGTVQDSGLWFANNGKVYPVIKYGSTCFYSDDPESVMTYSVAGSMITVTFPHGKTVTSAVSVVKNSLTMADLSDFDGEMTLTRFTGSLERLSAK